METTQSKAFTRDADESAFTRRHHHVNTTTVYLLRPPSSDRPWIFTSESTDPSSAVLRHPLTSKPHLRRHLRPNSDLTTVSLSYHLGDSYPLDKLLVFHVSTHLTLPSTSQLNTDLNECTMVALYAGGELRGCPRLFKARNTAVASPWVKLSPAGKKIDDVAFHKGNIYAVDRQRRVNFIDVNPKTRKISFGKTLIEGYRSPSAGRFGWRKRLVSDGGSLYLVVRTKEEVFKVFKMKSRVLRRVSRDSYWEEVKGFGGNKVLFMARDHCFFREALKKFPGKEYKNCIVFSEAAFPQYGKDCWEFTQNDDGVSKCEDDIAVFRLGDGVFAREGENPCFPEIDWSPPSWMFDATECQTQSERGLDEDEGLNSGSRDKNKNDGEMQSNLKDSDGKKKGEQETMECDFSDKDQDQRGLNSGLDRQDQVGGEMQCTTNRQVEEVEDEMHSKAVIEDASLQEEGTHEAVPSSLSNVEEEVREILLSMDVCNGAIEKDTSGKNIVLPKSKASTSSQIREAADNEASCLLNSTRDSVMDNEVDDKISEDCDDDENHNSEDTLSDDKMYDNEMEEVLGDEGEIDVSEKDEEHTGRGATKRLRVSEPMYLEFDDLGRPKGKWQLKYGQHVGFCMRKLNINWKWKDVSEEMKKLLWEDTRNLFHIADEKRLKKNFLSLVAKRFRDFKSKLVSGWITKTQKRTKFENLREPPKIWKHIKVEDWQLFQQVKTTSVAMSKREKAIQSAKKNEHHHHMGQKSYNTARSVWIKDGFYPGSTSSGTDSTTLMTVDGNRADDWFCAMHSKDKESGKYEIKDPTTKEVAGKLLEFKKKEIEGELTPCGFRDALYFALGEKEEHPSRVRGLGGVNVGLRDAFGMSGESKRSRKDVSSSEVRDAIKQELKEELINEMKLEFQNSLSSILKEMGLPTTKLPDICLGHDRNHQKPSVPKEIQNDTSCRLFLKDSYNGVSREVARGKIYPGEVCHQGLVSPDHLRVKVLVVPKESETLPLPLPVPAYDLNLLVDAVGSFVQWPIALVVIENEGVHDPKDNEFMGSNSHISRLSIAPIQTHPVELIVQSLSPDCQWLKTLVNTMAAEETYTIYFDAHTPLFYYDEEGKIEVCQDDLERFLEGSVLNISIMQISMRALREDLVKAKNKVQIGWLCPAATADSRLKKKTEDAITYISNAFLRATINGDKFILAPIIDNKHWVLLAICPRTYTIYEFDPNTIKEGRKLHVKMVVLSALKRFKMSVGQLKVERKEPLWKSMTCPQQSGGMQHGFFVMRFMHDIVKSCSSASDLEKVWGSRKGKSRNYNDDEINEVRDKWATYFTSRCIN